MAKSLLTNKSWFDRNQAFINVLLHNILDTIGCKHPPAKENVLNLVLVELSILSFNMICRLLKIFVIVDCLNFLLGMKSPMIMFLC